MFWEGGTTLGGPWPQEGSSAKGSWEVSAQGLVPLRWGGVAFQAPPGSQASLNLEKAEEPEIKLPTSIRS